MKKSIRMSVKPLAMATAFAAGTSVSMIATALPGGDTLGAAGVVNESICTSSVDVVVASGARSVTSGTGDCQLRTLPPTKGLVLTESAPAGGSVADSSALVPAGGELYEAYVGGNRDAAVLLTPNRALMTSRAIEFAPGNGGSVSFDMFAAVQPVSGLQASWLTGTYNIMTRNHNYSMLASGLENSPYANPNFALGERNYTGSMQVQFNGDGTCDILERDNHTSATLVKDPLMAALGEMDVDCFVGGGNCGQNDGNNYIAMGNLNIGSTFVDGSGNSAIEADWNDASGDPDSNGSRQLDCSYTVGSGHVVVNYSYEFGDLVEPVGTLSDVVTWSTQYDVSKDLRYLVSSDGTSTDALLSGGNGVQKGGIAVGVRQGVVSLVGKTYLFNALDANNAASTPNTASYENPAQPVYQEEECISRGSLSLAAAGACTINTVNTCSGRFKEGYEETSDGAADGTIVDQFTVFDGAPALAPSCAWSGDSTNLQVDMTVLDQEGNIVTLAYTGSASDNGEALVLQGIYSDPGAGAPDLDNPPLLPQMKYNLISYMVAQEYQGTLSADADADGLTNLAEFQWASNLGPANPVDNDYNGDGVSDILMTKPSTGENFVFPFANGEATGYAKGGLYPSTSWVFQTASDFDGDGDTDVIMRGPTEWHIFNMQNGVALSGTKISLYGGSWVFDSVGDFNGDGTDDILLTDGTQFQRFTIEDRVVTSNGKMSLYGAPWVVVTAADFDGDGDDDILMRNADTKAWRIFTVQNGSVVSNANFAAFGGTWEFMAAADFDGDLDDDVLLRNSVDGAWRTFLVQNNAVVSSVNTGLFPSLQWDFAFASDLNADGTTDVVIKNLTKGEWWRGVLAGGVVNSSAKFRLYASNAWELAAQNDFNGDGTEDVILFKPSSNEYFTSGIQGGEVTFTKKSKIFPVAPSIWTIQD